MFRQIEADCYLMIDGDDTYPVENAREMCDIILEGKADMVIGDRLSSTYFTENKRPFHNLGNKMVRFLINRLFNMFAAVPYDTKEWVGNQSDKFFDLVALEKADFISFGDRIREYGEKLNNDVNDIENTVNTVIRKEDNEVQSVKN